MSLKPNKKTNLMSNNTISSDFYLDSISFKLDSTEIYARKLAVSRVPSRKYVLIIKYVEVTVNRARYKVARSRSQLLGDCELIKSPARLGSAISLSGAETVQLRLRVIFQKINARAIPKARFHPAEESSNFDSSKRRKNELPSFLFGVS